MIMRYIDGVFVADEIIEDDDEKERKQFLKELDDVKKEKEEKEKSVEGDKKN